MNGPDRGKRKQPCVRRVSTHACLAASACLALSLLAGAAAPAAAQGIWDPDYVPGPPPIPPRDVGFGHPTAWAAPPPPPPYSYYPPAPYSNRPPTPYYYGGNPPPTPYNAPTPTRVSVAEMRRIAEAEGLRLLGTPHRQGRVYLAFAEDGRGILHHLSFDAYAGTLVENETTGVSAKPVPHKASLNTETTTLSPKPSVNPQTTTAVSPKPSVNPDSQHKNATSQPSGTQQSNTAQQASQKPSSSSSAVKDQELTPIKPQPGVKTQPLPDNEIDKD